MPDLIRHPEVIELTGFSDKSENDIFKGFSTFYETVNFEFRSRAAQALAPRVDICLPC